MGLYRACVGQFLVFGARSGAGAGQLSSYIAGAGVGAMFLLPVPVNIGMLVLAPV